MENAEATLNVIEQLRSDDVMLRHILVCLVGYWFRFCIYYFRLAFGFRYFLFIEVREALFVTWL